MAEYLEREKLLNAIEEMCKRVCIYSPAQRYFMCRSCPLGSAFELVEKFPAKDAQLVKHGRWETEEVNVGSHTGGIATINIFRCSCCDEENNYEWDYCPNCGADMRGE